MAKAGFINCYLITSTNKYDMDKVLGLLSLFVFILLRGGMERRRKETRLININVAISFRMNE